MVKRSEGWEVEVQRTGTNEEEGGMRDEKEEGSAVVCKKRG